MFEHSSIIALIESEEGTLGISRIEMDEKTRKVVCQNFANAVSLLLDGKERVEFDGNYKPEDNECLMIHNFGLTEICKEALRNPMNAETYRPSKNHFPEIKALIVGECSNIDNEEHFQVAFQKFRKDQYISTHKLNLLFDKDSFFQEKRTGICISNFIDCYFGGTELFFTSFYYAQQIFDLSEYYREATDGEVDNFTEIDILDIENITMFQKQAVDKWIRRRVSIINDSGVLNDYSASAIKKIGKLAGIDIKVENKKVVIPQDKNEMKKIIAFLVEEIYTGYFSKGTIYMANSKKKV